MKTGVWNSSKFHNRGSVNRKWLGSDKIRCIMINEKGTKAEEKVSDFCKQSSIKRTVLIISYEVSLNRILINRCIGNMLS